MRNTRFNSTDHVRYLYGYDSQEEAPGGGCVQQGDRRAKEIYPSTPGRSLMFAVRLQSVCKWLQANLPEP